MERLSYKTLLTIVIILLIGIVAILRLQQKPGKVLAEWWNDNWSFRQSINISSHTSQESNVYIIATVNIGTTLSSQTDNGDFRFIDQNGNPLAYYISANAGTTAPTFHIFFSTFTAGAQTIYAYYGNPSASNGFSPTDFSTQASAYVVGTNGTEEKGAGPIAYYKFDEGVGTTAYDSTDFGNNAVLNEFTAPSWVAGKFGSGLHFNSDNDWVDFYSTSLASLFSGSRGTVTVWAKVQNLGTWTNGQTDVIFKLGTDANNSVHIQKNNTNEIDFIYAAGSTTTSTTHTTTTTDWFQVAITWDKPNDQVKYYYNGQLLTTGTGLGTWSGSLSSTRASIGNNYNGTSGWNGNIDDFKIYNYPLSAAQILQNYKSSGSLSAVQIGTNLIGLDNGLVGWWKMDENIGTTTTDSSGNNNTATFGTGTSAPTWATGKFGIGLSLDGTTDYATVADNDSLSFANNTMSAAAWVKRSGNPAAAEQIILKGSSSNWEYGMDIHSDGSLEVDLWRSSGTAIAYDSSSSTVTDGNWHHLAMTSDGITLTLYVDGKVDSVSKSFNGSMSNTTSTFYIGDRPDSADAEFQGQLDEVRLYNRVLSPDEVQKLYNWAPGPTLYLQFDENTGTSMTYDVSGLGYGGSMVGGFTNSSWKVGKFGSSLYFDGTDDQIDVPNFNYPLNDFTYEAWINPNDTSTSNTIFSKSTDSVGGIEFNVDTDTDYDIDVIIGSTLVINGPNNKLARNRWDHIAVVRLGTTISTYINGQLDVGATISGSPLLAYSCPLSIGLDRDSNNCVNFDSWFNGMMDEVKVYNYARTQAQIVEDMNGGSHLSSKTALVYYKFDEGYGTTANDSSENQLNLTLSSSTWQNDGKFNKAWNGDGSNWATIADVGTSNKLDFTANSDFSISLWFKSDSATNPAASEYLLSKAEGSPGYRIFFDNTTNGDVFFATDDDTSWTPGDKVGAVSTDYYDATWHHLVGVKTGISKMELYIDGNLVNSKIGLGETGTLENSVDMFIGDRNGVNGGDEFVGDIDEFKIYSYALTPADVLADYNRSSVIILGSLSNGSGNTAPNSASSQLYCVPGDTATCSPPVGEWLFDEGTGTTTYDTSSNNNNMTLLGSMSNSSWKVGKKGQALSFNGTSDYTQAADNGLYESDNFTLESWVRLTELPSVTGASCTLFVKSHSVSPFYSYYLTIDTSNEAQLGWVNVGTTERYAESRADFSQINTWYHVATVKSGTTAAQYVNGVDRTRYSDSLIGSTYNSNNFLWIGAQGAGTQARCRATIDDPKIFNYARTPAQIAWDYNRGGPIGQWKFDECQGSTLYDSINVGNTASITIGVGGTQPTLGTCAVGSTSSWSRGSSGKTNSALSLDGTDDYVIRSGSSLPTVDFTYSAWIYMNRLNNDNAIFKSSEGTGTNEVKLSVVSDQDGTNPNKVRFVVDGTSMYSQQKLFTGSWYHIAAKRTGATMRIYINGQLDGASGSDASALNFGSCRLYIGASPGATCDTTLIDYFNGKIDDLQIYSYALTDTQVKDIYNNGAINIR